MDRSFTEVAQEEIKRATDMRAYSKAANYGTALRSLLMFAGGRPLRLADIDGTLMERWQAWLMQRGVCKNTVSCYMRSVRAIYRRTTDCNAMQAPDPFKNVFTSSTRTSKRAITAEELRRIAMLRLPEGSRIELVRDLFLFSYFCLGMAFVDMAFLLRGQVCNGDICYNRRKTRQPVRIHIESCINDIIRRYEQENSPYVFPIISAEDPRMAYQQYLQGLHRYNCLLKRLAQMAGVDGRLTSYVSRHSWATSAYASNVDLQVIAKAMGHANPNTTLIYIKEIDDSRIVDANRTLIHEVCHP
ncbi:MAG: site-specific integrase [Prevotella sp.]|nr:site-specific integrase [Prevotella sp.]